MRWHELVRGTVFPEATSLVGEAFGAAVAASEHKIVLHCHAANETAARDYLAVIGREAGVEVHPADVDFAALERSRSEDIHLIFLAAIDPSLKDWFFLHPRLNLFADHHYSARARHESPLLFTVGTTAAGMAALHQSRPQEVPASQRCDALRARYGERFFGYDRFGSVLRSPRVEQVRVHALGPRGTNIVQACERFISSEKIESKAELIVHERKVEPLEYASLAAAEAREGVLPLHAECAVYYALAELYERRPREVVFAGHCYMPLDGMRIASKPDFDPGFRGALTIAAHPSPIGLIQDLLGRGLMRHTRASSNADAAEMVRCGEAHLCITTEAGCRASGLTTLHRFGSPIMIFTIGASAGNETLRGYLSG